MTWERFRVHLEDECPKIGSGRRVVVAEIGTKWVRVRVPGDERGTRIAKEIWNTLKPVELGPVK